MGKGKKDKFTAETFDTLVGCAQIIGTVMGVIALLVSFLALVWGITYQETAIDVIRVISGEPTATPTVTPTPTISSDATTDFDLAQIQGDLDSLNSRLKVIEQAVLESPAKALELTLVRTDMENLQQRYQADLQSTREELRRVYDLTKWFLGLMFTMIVGLVSLTVSQFLSRPRKEDKNRTAKEVNSSEE